MALPKAAAGYFLSPTVVHDAQYATGDLDFLRKAYHACTPLQACVGTCTDEQIQAEQPDFTKCSGGMGTESCAKGYVGKRCAACVGFDDLPEGTEVCDNGVSNVYYRLNELCEACPCDGSSLETTARSDAPSSHRAVLSRC